MWPWLFYTQIKGSERGLCSQGLRQLCETLPLAITTLKIRDRDSSSHLVDFHSCSCRHLQSGFIPTISPPSSPSSHFIMLLGICFSGSLWILP